MKRPVLFNVRVHCAQWSTEDTIWNRTSDLPICSTAPSSLCYRGPLCISLLYLILNTSGVPKGGLGCSNPPPRDSEGPPKSCKTQPDCEICKKIAEFRTPTPQDVRKKGSKILKLPRFAIVLY